MSEYTFIIPGACPPKGSRVPVGKRGRATRESSKRVEPWTRVAVAAMRGPDGKPRASFSGPVYVGLTFTFKRPKVTEFDFPTAPTIGDVDKLCRTALDALTKADVIEDDRFVAQIRDPVKLWAPASATIIQVGNVTPEELEARAWQITTAVERNLPPSRNPFADLGSETHQQQAERRIREAISSIAERIPGDLSACPYTQAHTRAWCGYPGCRES